MWIGSLRKGGGITSKSWPYTSIYTMIWRRMKTTSSTPRPTWPSLINELSSKLWGQRNYEDLSTASDEFGSMDCTSNTSRIHHCKLSHRWQIGREGGPQCLWIKLKWDRCSKCLGNNHQLRTSLLTYIVWNCISFCVFLFISYIDRTKSHRSWFCVPCCMNTTWLRYKVRKNKK